MRLLLFLLALPLWGQISLVCPASAVQGSAVDCSEMGPGGSISGYQTVLTLPASISPTVTTGTAALTAQKQASCNALWLCLVSGYNRLTMAPGEWMHIRFTIPSTLTGNIQLCLSAPVASDPDGFGLPITTGPCVAVSISPSISKCDINGDGQITTADVDAERQKVLAIPQVPGDLNQDGKTDILDVQKVSAALNGSCLAL